MVFRKRSSDPAVNPNRTSDLFALTAEGYVIAQDIACQNEFIDRRRCPDCGGVFVPIAHLNRSFQGLNEIVTVCQQCGERFSFIFDISNTVYQSWWAEQMGEMYVRVYDGPPRQPRPE